MTLVCMSHGIGNNIFNPIYESGDKITLDINPKYGQMHWPSPDNSKKRKGVEANLYTFRE